MVNIVHERRSAKKTLPLLSIHINAQHQSSTISQLISNSYLYLVYYIANCEKVMADSMHFSFSNNGTEKTKCNFQCHGADYIKIYRQHGIYSMSPAILTILMFLCRCLLARRKSQVVPWSTVICRALLYCCNVCLFRKILLFC